MIILLSFRFSALNIFLHLIPLLISKKFISENKFLKFNIELNPSNITVAFYSPFIGTSLQSSSANDGLFDEYVYSTDPQLRSLSAEGDQRIDMLSFYKREFSKLVRGGLDQLPNLKEEYFS